MEDATGAQIHDEPDTVVEAIARGDLGATVETQRLAQQELAYRSLQHDARFDAALEARDLSAYHESLGY